MLDILSGSKIFRFGAQFRLDPVVEEIFFQDLPGQGYEGYRDQFVSPGPEVVQSLPDVMVFPGVDLRGVVEGDEVVVLLDMLAGAEENRLNGQARQIHNPIHQALL